MVILVMCITLDTNIIELDFSVRTTNCLVREGIETVNDLIEYDLDKISDIRNLGRKSVKEILLFLNTLVLENDEEKQPGMVYDRIFSDLNVNRTNEMKLIEVGVKTIFDLVKIDNRSNVERVLGSSFTSTINKLNEIIKFYPFEDTLNINSFNLSVRSLNALYRKGVFSITDLIKMTDKELQEIQNLGRKSVSEIVSLTNIVKLVIRDSSTFSYDYNLNLEALKEVRHWSRLEFLNLPKTYIEEYQINSVNALCEIYTEIAKSPLDFDLKFQSKIIQSLETLLTSTSVLFNGFNEYLYDFLERLKISDRDILIISKRIDHTLEEIAIDLGVTRERIRQIISKKSAIISNEFYNTLLPNVITHDYLNKNNCTDIEKAIYYAVYNDSTVKILIEGSRKLVSKSVVQKYNLFADMTYSLIKAGYQPEVNKIFTFESKYIYSQSDRKAFLDSIIPFKLNYSEYQDLRNYISNNEVSERDFCDYVKNFLLNIIYSKHYELRNLDSFNEFITSEIQDFVCSFYKIWASGRWMVKVSDRFYEYYRASLRKYKFYSERSYILDDFVRVSEFHEYLNEHFNETNGLLPSEFYINFIKKIDESNVQILLKLLNDKKVYFQGNILTTRCSISEICKNFMRRYSYVIDTTEEKAVDVLNDYFIEYGRYIFRSRNIINALGIDKGIISLDYSRFVLTNFRPFILADFIVRNESKAILAIKEFFQENSNQLVRYGIFNIEVVYELIEYYFNDELSDFGESRSMLMNRKLCNEEESEQINDELLKISANYKNPSYTSVFSKLSSDMVTWKILKKHEIKEVSEFKSFVDTINSGSLNIFDKSRSSSISISKKKTLHSTLLSYELGFTFTEYVDLLNEISNNAINTKYFNLRPYYQIDKEVFIHESHLDDGLIAEIENCLKDIQEDYITIKKIKEYIHDWINPYLAMSVLSKKNDNYSPIEQHGKLRLDNPILSKRTSDIYSLYNLIYFILKSSYKGSFSETAVVDYLKNQHIITQKKLPRYFFELGFAELIEGIIVLKQDTVVSDSNQNELFDFLDDYFE